MNTTVCVVLVRDDSYTLLETQKGVSILDIFSQLPL